MHEIRPREPMFEQPFFPRRKQQEKSPARPLRLQNASS